MELTNCEHCRQLLPKHYDFCPWCVFGIEARDIGRVLCRNCNTIVGEHVITDDYYEYIEKCDYCDPPADATDSDVVERFHFWYVQPGEAPKRTLVTRTRTERRINIEDRERFRNLINEKLKNRKQGNK